MTVYSFDIFDTILTRKVLHPKDVFFLVRDRLPELTSESPPRLSHVYWGSRVWAEFVSRRRSKCEDVKLTEIYSVLAELLYLDADLTQRLLELELAVEGEVLTVIDGAVELVAAARLKGGVIFISDMYLPETFLAMVLSKFGLRELDEAVYVSGDVGLTKGSGKLFLQVLSDYNLHPHQLVHCGDHSRSDRSIPSRLGIRLHPKAEQGCSTVHDSRLNYGVELLRAFWQLQWNKNV